MILNVIVNMIVNMIVIVAFARLHKLRYNSMLEEALSVYPHFPSSAGSLSRALARIPLIFGLTFRLTSSQNTFKQLPSIP